ncbi:MAG: sugar phosphate nucleotidyltransferase [Capsulimonadaceae bacterium]|nr:sugar phosphate nucleotidyltransferase [Capsulimonadaceae bacterium]
MPQKIAVVIPAGGGGTRLWPRSRQKTPKQFLDIVTPGVSMLQETAARVCPNLVASDHLYVITNKRHIPLVREQLASTPSVNFVGEPMGRDSAPAIGLMAALLERRHGAETVMVALPADHVILDPAAFRDTLRVAIDAAVNGSLVTLGIPPAGPDTGFGYIRRGSALADGDIPVYNVAQFREKPDRATAEAYVASNEYFWNAGMFIATVGHFRSLYKQHLPEMEPAIAQLVDAAGTDSEEEVFAKVFPTLPKVSIDYAIIEKADRVAVVPAHIGWNDVGSWTRLAEIQANQANADANIVTGELRAIDARASLVHAPGKLVALIGLDNLIVIDTEDALLIADRSRSDEVKKIVEQLQTEGRSDLL